MLQTCTIPDHIWDLAKAAHIKAQIEPALLSGNYKNALERIEAEGKAVAEELNTSRPSHVPPFAFQALVAEPTTGMEDEQYFLVLQQLYVALSKHSILYQEQ